MNTNISILARMQGKKDIHQIPPDSLIRLGSFFARPCLHFLKKKYVLMQVSKSERAREREREKDYEQLAHRQTRDAEEEGTNSLC